MPEAHAQRITISGRVQGVGFRPFVYRLAHRYQIAGWVRNIDGLVEIHAEGTPAQLQNFRQALLQEAPPLSAPDSISVADCSAEQAGLSPSSTAPPARAMPRRPSLVRVRSICHPMASSARTAWPNCMTRPTAATATPSSTAPSAARATP
jgi:acylphosphatase